MIKKEADLKTPTPPPPPTAPSSQSQPITERDFRFQQASSSTSRRYSDMFHPYLSNGAQSDSERFLYNYHAAAAYDPRYYPQMISPFHRSLGLVLLLLRTYQK